MNSRSVLAFLVMALNPRRPYDEDYKGFMHLLTQQVTTPQLSAVILREEVERRQLLERQEALDPKVNPSLHVLRKELLSD
jgi:hypothetical protein